MENDDLKQAALKEMATRELARRTQQNSDLQGGATSPANVKAQADLKQAQFNASPVGLLPTEAKAIAEPIGRAANSAMFGIPGITSELLSGGKLVNPLNNGGRVTQGGTNIFEGKDMSQGQQMTADLAGALVPGGALLKGLGIEKNLGNVVKYSKPQNQVKLADEVQNSLMSQKRNVIDKYGKEYDSIIGQSDKKVNIDPAIKNFVDEAQSLMQNPDFVQQVAVKNPQATKIFDMVNGFKEATGTEAISAKEADNLSKFIKNMPGIKSKLAQASKNGYHTVQWTNEDRMLLGLADDIKGQIVEAHGELGALNKDYGQFMNAYKKVAPDFKVGTTINKLKNYGEYDPQKQQLLEGILPKQTVDKIKDFSRADATSKVLKKIGLWGATGALGAAGLGEARKLLH